MSEMTWTGFGRKDEYPLEDFWAGLLRDRCVLRGRSEK